MSRQDRTLEQIKNWHRGTATEITGMSLDEQLIAARLDWSVETSGFVYGADFEHKEEKTKVAFRSDTGEYIDVYTKRRPWQNRDILQHFHDFCGEAGLELSHLGSLEGGKTLYAAAYLCQSDVLKVGDFTDHYLLLKDSHLNGKGLSATLYSNRCVCTNGLHTTVRAGNKTIAHVGEFSREKVTTLLNAAVETLNLKNEQLEVLATTAITKEEAMLNLIKAFGVAGEPVSEQPKVVQTCLRLFEGEGEGSELISAYNSAYGLLQSVTQYFNWHGRSSAAATQFQSVLSGSRSAKMQQFQRQLVGVYVR